MITRYFSRFGVCVLACLLPLAAFGKDHCSVTTTSPSFHSNQHVFSIEGKAAYFHPISPTIRNIYSSNMGMYGIEASFDRWDWARPWISGDYLSTEGHSLDKHNFTTATLVPLGFGFKFMHRFKYAGLYLAIGPLYTYIHMHDNSPYVIHSISKWAWGGIEKAGVCFFIKNSLLIDIFAGYSYIKFDFQNGRGKVVRQDVDFSGWSIGGAIGFAI